jgi:hypothetical protein
MTPRTKLFSAASAIAMAMAIGSAQAAELLTADQLDSVAAGAFSSIASTGANIGGSSAGTGANAVLIPGQVSCTGPCVVWLGNLQSSARLIIVTGYAPERIFCASW